MSLWVSSWLTKHLILFLNHTDLDYDPKWIKNKNNVIINTVTRVNCFSVYWFNYGADADSSVVQRLCFIQIESVENSYLVEWLNYCLIAAICEDHILLKCSNKNGSVPLGYV